MSSAEPDAVPRTRMAMRGRQLILFVGMCGFFAVAVYVSFLIAARQEALKNVSRYDICFEASQAVAELTRLEAKLAAFGIPGTGVDADDVQLRLDIMTNRLGMLGEGEFEDFVRQHPDKGAAAQDLAKALAAVRPLIDRLGQPGTIAAALAILAPLDGELASLAASANRFGADQVARDQSELIRLHWIFSTVAGALFLCGVGLLALVGWHNQLLGRAQIRQQRLTQDLRRSAHEVERAHAELVVINGELEARNRVLQRRDLEIGTQNERFDAALNNMSQALCMVDAQGRLVVYNQRFAVLFDVVEAPVPGTRFSALVETVESRDLEAVYRRQESLARQHGSVSFVHEFPDGRSVSVSHQAMLDGGWVATFEDITQRRQAQAQITYLAQHDGLTGLVNRGYFHRRLSVALSEARDGDAPAGTRGLAVFCLDIDGFKDVNDNLGHTIGDGLLREIGERLRRRLREGDVVARLGGDEFGVLCHGVAEEAEAAAWASRLSDAMALPFHLEGRDIQVSVSIGVALAPRDGATAEIVVKNADLALHRAKAEGKGTFRWFEPEMEAERRKRHDLEQDLRAALGRGELEVYYQPLIDSRAVAITGFEALMRWRHPVRGMVSPAEFIPIAESIGIIAALGEWVLAEACRQAATWPHDLTVAVNLSPAQFKSSNLVQAVQNALIGSGLPPGRLELEITESVLLDDSDSTLATLHALRGQGIRIALDDFGTGFSSLSYLRRFPFDKIKIDQSFVRELSQRSDCVKIVSSIAALGASLGMTTTAEGVETLEQFAQLQDAGCDQVQGYYFGRPGPGEQLRYVLVRPAEMDVEIAA